MYVQSLKVIFILANNAEPDGKLQLTPYQFAKVPTYMFPVYNIAWFTYKTVHSYEL